ncbi:MAG: hypothetical protein JWQ88_3259, partial [Rhodoferax sp.]|nr:hypothetical protein [Rhodoferax sp.]
MTIQFATRQSAVWAAACAAVALAGCAVPA